MEERSGKNTSEGFRDGMRSGIGILSALKDAIDETIDDMRRRGELSPERAAEAMRGTMRRAQEMMGETRERFDFVPRAEFDELKAEVADLRRRIDSDQEGGTTRDIPVE